MLEYFYKWLAFNSASPGDASHRAALLVQTYWKSACEEPFNLDRLFNSLIGLNSEASELLLGRIAAFIERTHYMAFYEMGWIFIEPYEVRKYSHRVARVKFTLDDMVVIEYV